MMAKTIEIPIWWAVAIIAGVVLVAAVALKRCAGSAAPAAPGLY